MQLDTFKTKISTQNTAYSLSQKCVFASRQQRKGDQNAMKRGRRWKIVKRRENSDDGQSLRRSRQKRMKNWNTKQKNQKRLNLREKNYKKVQKKQLVQDNNQKIQQKSQSDSSDEDTSKTQQQNLFTNQKIQQKDHFPQATINKSYKEQIQQKTQQKVVSISKTNNKISTDKPRSRGRPKKPKNQVQKAQDQSIKAKIQQYFSSQPQTQNEQGDPVSIKGFWKSKYWKDLQHLFGRKRVQKILRMSNVSEIKRRAFALIRLQHLFENKFGQRIAIDIQPTCKYYNQFNVRQHQLQKKGTFYCQIYNKNPVPIEGRHYFQVRVLRLTLRMVIVGIITPQNFQNQYSCNKPNCICFDGYTHSIYQQGKQIQLPYKTRVHDSLRIVIQIPLKLIEFYINHDMIWSGKIPQNMLSQPIYPHFQTSNKSVKIKINKFQDGMKV